MRRGMSEDTSPKGARSLELIREIRRLRLRRSRRDAIQVTHLTLMFLAWTKLTFDEELPADLALDRWLEKALDIDQPKLGLTVELGEAFSQLNNFCADSELGRFFPEEDEELKKLPDDAVREAMWLFSHLLRNRINVGETLPSDYAGAAVEAFRFGAPAGTLHETGATLMAKLGGVNSKSRVYAPYLGSFPLALASCRAGGDIVMEVPEAENSTGRRGLEAIAYLSDCAIRIKTGDPVQGSQWGAQEISDAFDVSLAVLDLTAKYHDLQRFKTYDRYKTQPYYGEALQLQHILERTKSRAVVIASGNFLSRTSGGDRDFKAQLVYDGHLAAVIELPRRIAGAPFSGASILVLDMESQADGVLFIDGSNEELATRSPESTGDQLDQADIVLDADKILKVYQRRGRETESSQWSCFVDRSDIAANNFDLGVTRYIHPWRDELDRLLGATQQKPLEELARIIRPQSTKSASKKKLDVEEDDPPAAKIFEIGISDITQAGLVQRPETPSLVSEGVLQAAYKQELKPSDVLLSVNGSIGEVAIVPQKFEGIWIAKQAMLIIRLQSELIDSITLAMYLRSPQVQTALKAIATKGAVPRIAIKDIKSFPVMLPTEHQREAAADAFAAVQKISQAQTELARLLTNVSDIDWEQDGRKPDTTKVIANVERLLSEME